MTDNIQSFLWSKNATGKPVPYIETLDSCNYDINNFCPVNFS